MIEKRGIRAEILLVLGVSLGSSAIYAILNIINRLTYVKPLSEQTATLNPTVVADRPWLDLLYQLANIGLGVVPALLAVHLLRRAHEDLAVGLDRRRPGFDLLSGVGMAALIGLPGLGLVWVARRLGVSAQIVPEALGDHWWSVPVLVLSAVENGVLEEVVMIAYLLTRLRDMQWGWWPAVVTSAVIRGSYHLYQGFGGFVGNFVMGLVFGYFFRRTQRVMPLIIAHSILDIVSFVGYALLKDHLGFLN
ncbi:CPBP family intramembrane glutamic endopeptidase [Dactylosporangium matsuzakiense]|uniref:CAAX amino protease n=1 Tax=Dactylosporangium matsuzakiense TaxID=53360 RepID=A0A9W6KPT9_9ACTN|nr:CPBP family intramembrane glutamic endopeptidase [Dactylosporangium matsuzakiense]UWZ44709.1 CPBP family intramembrane metalloprotease [Dactylosporangium matsuzakiense]GLL05956.1 CAAX amino protease [Dactylosporangium matsuzakiense]